MLLGMSKDWAVIWLSLPRRQRGGGQVGATHYSRSIPRSFLWSTSTYQSPTHGPAPHTKVLLMVHLHIPKSYSWSISCHDVVPEKSKVWSFIKTGLLTSLVQQHGRRWTMSRTLIPKAWRDVVEYICFHNKTLA